MQRPWLQVTGTLLLALTVMALTLVGLRAWRGMPLPSLGAGGSGGRSAVVREVEATNLLRLEGGQQVRLAALVVPAVGQPFAAEGRNAAEALVQGQRVRLEEGPGGSYVYLPEGQLLQGLLLSGGYAQLGEGLPDDATVQALRNSEAEARQRNVGLWAAPNPATFPTAGPTSAPIACTPALVAGNSLSADQAAEAVGQEANVIFMVLGATSRNGAVTLLSGLSEEFFGVTIPPGLALSEAEPALRYLSRCVVATGRIERDPTGNPRLTIRAFEQLQILR